mmetsp:Transcript_109577/g.251282  ORF Transcript_109577/g.251282 Transcript_109577/m.251282 type:complete len:220 (+) Transcript_109577:535-1194(+)
MTLHFQGVICGLCEGKKALHRGEGDDVPDVAYHAPAVVNNEFHTIKFHHKRLLVDHLHYPVTQPPPELLATMHLQESHPVVEQKPVRPGAADGGVVAHGPRFCDAGTARRQSGSEFSVLEFAAAADAGRALGRGEVDGHTVLCDVQDQVALRLQQVPHPRHVRHPKSLPSSKMVVLLGVEHRGLPFGLRPDHMGRSGGHTSGDLVVVHVAQVVHHMPQH